MAAFSTACMGGVYEEPPRATRSSAPVIPSHSTSPRDTVLLQPAGSRRVRAVQRGVAKVKVGSSSLAGGALASGPGPTARQDRAFVFPSYVAGDDLPYPRAVLTVVNRTDEDVLDPGDHDFSWGASFLLDDSSEGRDDDNGNNLLQRGLFSQPTFYKAEVDDDRAACSVRGLRGVVLLHSSYTMPTGVWHRLECDRFGDYVRLRVWDLATGQLVSTAAKTATIGTLSTPSGHPKIPLAVGGKVNPDGRITAKASDQFNGSIAAPFLRIDD